VLSSEFAFALIFFFASFFLYPRQKERGSLLVTKKEQKEIIYYKKEEYTDTPMPTPILLHWTQSALKRSLNTITGLKNIKSPPDKCVIDGCEIGIPTDLFSFNVIEEFVSGNYELQERKLITKYIKSSDRVLELGGGVGAVSCMLNKKLADQSKHLVIEANPELIPILEHNGINNNCRFKTLNCIPIKSSNGKFYLKHNAWAGSNVRKSKKCITVPR